MFKMKICLLLLLVLPGFFAMKNPFERLRNHWKNATKTYVKECMRLSHVKPAIVDEFFKTGRNPDDPCWKCNMQCLGARSGVFNTGTGKFNVKKWSEMSGFDPVVAERCAKFEDQDQCEKVYKAVECALDDLRKRYPT